MIVSPGRSIVRYFVGNAFLRESHAREITGLSDSDNMEPWLDRETDEYQSDNCNTENPDNTYRQILNTSRKRDAA